jgi:hypothetical protein
MAESSRRIVRQVWNSLILWGSGWKRRSCGRGTHPVVEWCDPLSGLWHRPDAALRLARVQARDPKALRR